MTPNKNNSQHCTNWSTSKTYLQGKEQNIIMKLSPAPGVQNIYANFMNLIRYTLSLFVRAVNHIFMIMTWKLIRC